MPHRIVVDYILLMQMVIKSLHFMLQLLIGRSGVGDDLTNPYPSFITVKIQIQ